jgi:hypothetical protein
MDIEFIETKDEIIIHAGNPKGAGWITRMITGNLSAGVHYTDKKRALHILNTAAADGVRIARRGVDGGTGKINVTGEYHETGYEIFIDGKSAYSAGNAIGDSQMIVAPERGESIKNLRKFCVQTGREMAHERFAKWVGAARIPNPNKGEV